MLNAAVGIAHCTVPVPIASSMRPQTGRGRDSARADGPVNPSDRLVVGTFNTGRLWLQDGSVHDGFQMLTHMLEVESVSVLCLQEVHAGDFPTFLVNQSHVNPSGSRGRDAGFLIHEGVSCTPIRGVTDSVSVRWRVVQGKVCICSFYAPHAGFSEGDRISYWRDLLASARHVHSTMSLPTIMAGDANVWHPHFNLGRTRFSQMHSSFLSLICWRVRVV